MQLEVGSIVQGTVTGITKFGAFVDIGEGLTGMVHISEVSQVFVKEISEVLSEGDKVSVKILKLGEDGKVSLSIKAAMPKPTSSKEPYVKQSNYKSYNDKGRQSKFQNRNNAKSDELSFEDMMSKFKKSSDEKMSDLKRSGSIQDNRKRSK